MEKDLAQNLAEATALRVSSNYSRDSPDKDIATPVDASSSNQLPTRQNEESSSAEMSKTDTSRHEDGTLIEDLDLDILEALGNRVAEDRLLAAAIPKSIAVRLEDILKQDLPKEKKEKLIKEHAPPKNCVFIDPPKLNEEIKVSINETATKRDSRIIEKQKKITAGLALLGSAIVDIINNRKSEDKSLKLASGQIALIK